MKTVNDISEIYLNGKFLFRDLSEFDLSNLPAKTWDGINLEDINLKGTGIKFNPQKIKNQSLKESNLEGVDLSHLANKKTFFGGNKISYEDWNNVSLAFANLKGTGIKFNPQKIYRRSIERTNLEGIDLSYLPVAAWKDASIMGANLKGTGIKFNPQTVFASKLNSANLEGIDLSHLPMEAWKDVDIMGVNLKGTGIKFNPQDLKFKRISFCDLEGVDLSYLPPEAWDGIDIAGANLKGTGIRFNPQTINNKNLQLTNLEGLDFSHLSSEAWMGIDLRKTRLAGAKITFGAQNFDIRNMMYADLHGIDLSYLPPEVWHEQNLVGVNLSGTNVKLPPSVIIDENTKLDAMYNKWYVDKKCPFNPYEWYHKDMKLSYLVNYKEYLANKDIEYGLTEKQYQFLKTVGIDYIAKNAASVAKLEQLKLLDKAIIWHQKKGMIPHSAIVKKYPVEKIEDFNPKTWYRFSKYDIFHLHDEVKEYLVHLCLTFGVFENDAGRETRIQKLLNYLSHVPEYLSLDEYKKGISLGKDILERNYKLDKREIYTFSGNSIEEEYRTELKKTLTKKEFSKIKNGNNMALRHYVLENYTSSEEEVYTLNEMIDENDISTLNNIMQNMNHEEVLTINKLHLMCPSLKLTFDPDFYEFMTANFAEIVASKEYQGILSNIQLEYPKIKAKYGREINIVDCQRYLDSVSYINIEQGNDSLAAWCKMCGLPQGKFDAYQDIYNKTKERNMSSIPSVKDVNIEGQVNALMLDLNDPLNLVIGEPKLSNCCQKLGDAGEDCMIHASVSTNGRIFVVYDDKKQFLAQSWVWLNGDVVCFDNIEASDLLEKNKAQYESLVINAYRETARRLIEENQKTMAIYKERLKQNISPEERQKITDIIKYQTLRRITVGKGFSDVNVDEYFRNIPNERRTPEEYVSYINDSNEQRIILETGERVVTPPSMYKNMPMYSDIKPQIEMNSSMDENVTYNVKI